jgi:hypothetical protein
MDASYTHWCQKDEINKYAKLSASPTGKGRDFEQAVDITDVDKICQLKMDKSIKYFPLKIKEKKLDDEGILNLQNS